MLFGAGLLAMAVQACAQVAYPSKPITLVVGFPPGGSNDIVARIIATPLGEALGVPVVVENRPGANAILGTDHVARSAPDGYTITLGSASPLAISPSTYPKMPFDPLKDLTGITTVASTSELVAMHPSAKVNSLAELIALSQTRDVTLASSGNGGLPHLAIELLKKASKGKIVHVPYKGAGPAITDAMGGHVDGIVMDLPALLPGVRDGRLRPVVMADDKRSSALPTVPSAKEAGSPGLIAVNWFAVMAPAKTPKPIVDKLFAALTKVMQTPQVVKQLQENAMEPFLQPTTADFDAFFKKELVRWGAIARESGARVEQ
jgi:tripartite-type tricarboxylate transporter receptor subunit TctC